MARNAGQARVTVMSRAQNTSEKKIRTATISKAPEGSRSRKYAGRNPHIVYAPIA
jgi:hypothetical protein